jgi:hypothetical protein
VPNTAIGKEMDASMRTPQTGAMLNQSTRKSR